jgi:PAS domain S-box-containing protein
MDKSLKILFVEDVPMDAEMVWRELKKNKIGFTKLLVDNRDDYVAGLETFRPDIIISDYSLPHFDGMNALRLRNEKTPLTPFILVTGSLNEETAVECMKAGADDYVLKDNLSRIGPAVVNSINKIRLLEKKKEAEEALVESELKYRQLVTRSPDGIFIVDLSGKFLSVNNAICDNLKYSEEELLSMNIWNIVPEQYQSIQKQRLAAILNGESTNASAEYEVIGKDGISHSVEVLSVPYYRGKEIVGFQGIAHDTTERKKAEDKLRDSEERLKILFDYAPDAYYLSDLKGNFVDGNIAAEKLMGYKRDELIGKNFLKLNLLSIKQIPKAARLLVKNALGQATGPDEFMLSLKGGTEVDVEIITHPVKIKDQILVLGIARDMTERKRAEATLRQSEEKHRRIFENVQDVYYETSVDGTILDVSPSIEVISRGQYHRDDLIGMSMYEFYSDPGERQSLMAAIKARGSVTDFEIMLKNRDGSLIPCAISSKISLDALGRPEKIIGSMRDITERKRTLKALQESEEKFRRIFEEHAAVKLLIDPDSGIIIDANQSAAVYYGWSCEELKQMKINQINTLTPEEIKKKMESVMSQERTQFEFRHRRKDGSIRDVEVFSSKIKIGNKDMLHSIIHDITERKLAEEELIRAKEKAEESDRLKTAFLHNISHEIRTPMNAIVGFSALLGEPDVDTSTRDSYIDVIMKSSNHLLSIITDIIDISNIEAGVVKVNKNEITLNSLIRSLNDQFLPKAMEKGINLVPESGLPDKDSIILSDNTKLIQIISNFLNNSDIRLMIS